MFYIFLPLLFVPRGKTQALYKSQQRSVKTGIPNALASQTGRGEGARVSTGPASQTGEETAAGGGSLYPKHCSTVDPTNHAHNLHSPRSPHSSSPCGTRTVFHAMFKHFYYGKPKKIYERQDEQNETW